MKSNSNKCSYNLLLIAQVVLLTLKLANVINWSWWIVLIPTYIYGALMILGIIIVVATASIMKSTLGIKKHKDWWEV